MMQTRSWLVVGLAGTLVAVWFAPEGDAEATSLRAGTPSSVSETGASAATVVHGAADKPGTANLDVLGIRARNGDEADDRLGTLFSAAPWAAAKPVVPVADKPAVEAPPEPPRAPPLPFKELGRYEEAGQTVVFLQFGEQNLVVRSGETIADNYKVEGIDGTSMTLRYLPLNQVQTLELSGT
jgi:hypothetical protein